MSNLDEVTICSGKYILGKRIGEGSFGQIYTGINKYTKQMVAIKLVFACMSFLGVEKVGKATAIGLRTVYYETAQESYFHNISLIAGIPRIECFTEEADYNIMVMELLGPNLESLFDYCGRKFTPKTVLMLAEQMITRVEAVHIKNYIHRDIKPDNFLVGTGKESATIYILDFGLAQRFRDSKTHQHVPYTENKMLAGTVRYASINNHLGIKQSRRDDLEALGYVLIYLARGELPWQCIKAKTKEKKHERILTRKMGTPIEYMCCLIYPEFATYLHYCRGLKFEDRPDYTFLRQLFTSRMKKESMEFDLLYDWVTVESKNLLVPAVSANKLKDVTPSASAFSQFPKEVNIKEEQKDKSNSDEEKLDTNEEAKSKEDNKTEEYLSNEENEDSKTNDEMKRKVDEVFEKLKVISTLTKPRVYDLTVKDTLMEVRMSLCYSSC
eukprot:TRINITY_DN10304_c0_g1_i10.p1 TRINITY_DN10304_c0_g1~~TRINITY_DN10304_c0_g1_i10.p1  ORF type:complete len:440 (+),score=78.53 TRINITY_DN10304_c0_g1_i10:124-1443(+)